MNLLADVGIDGCQIVVAVHLKSVASEEQQCGVGAGDGALKFAEQIFHRIAAEIEPLDHGEAQAVAKYRRHPFGVIRWIAQFRRARVGAIADDQRNATLARPGGRHWKWWSVVKRSLHRIGCQKII